MKALLKASQRETKALAIAICAVLMCLLQARAGAWGRVGHEYVNGAAVATLPAGTSLAAFLTANKAYLITHSSDPDAWREHDRSEGPHHFIDLDAYGSPSVYALANLPAARADADKKFGRDTVERLGTVDWTIAQWTQTLTDALRAGDPDAILAAAAVLGHYVGDAHVPFHSCVNYDGQMSAQRGVHARFESRLVEETITPAEMAPAPAAVLPDVLEAARRWSGQSLDLVPAILTADLQARVQADAAKSSLRLPGPLPAGHDAVTGKPLPTDGSPAPGYYEHNPVYWKAFGIICRPIALARLNAAATDLGSAWLTAWTCAGKPDLARLRAPMAHGPLPLPDPGAR